MFSSKCAEVFCQSYENFAIVCTDCNLKTNAFNEFVLHYQTIHCGLQPTIKYEQVQAQTNILETTHTSLPAASLATPTDFLCTQVEENKPHIKVEICGVDEKPFSDSEDDVPIQELLKTNPLESLEFICPKCDKKYCSKQSLRTHLHRYHPDVKSSEIDIGGDTLSCTQCPDKSFSSYNALIRRERRECGSSVEPTNNDKFLVEDNIEILPTAVILQNEVEIKREKCQTENGNEIDEKEISVSDDDSTLQDLLNKTPQEFSQIACPLCDKKYIRRKSFRVHLRRRHPDFKLPRVNAAAATTTCAECPGKTFSTRKSLQRHRREKHVTSTVDNYPCPHCEKQFKTKDRVTTHLRCVHKLGKNSVLSGRYPCTQCDRVFSERYLLKRHEVRHTGVRNFLCPVPECGLAFYDSKALGAHRRFVHVGLRKFVCDICGFSTKTSSTLQTHIRSHTGERPYKCDQCDKCFSTSAAVIEHKVIHNSHIRPHVCDVCGKAFARPKALYHHKPLHLGIKKFICKICGKAYAQQAGLSAHKRQHTMDSFGTAV